MEEKRQELYKLIDIYGINHEKTLKVSIELDNLILEELKICC